MYQQQNFIAGQNTQQIGCNWLNISVKKLSNETLFHAQLLQTLKRITQNYTTI